MRKIFSNNTTKMKTNVGLTKNERLTLFLSSSAILISLGQLIFTSQFFTDMIVKPEIYVSAKDYEVFGGNIVSTFKIINKGNKTAEDLIISMTCFANDDYAIVPLNILDTTVRKNGEPLKNIVIKVSKFVPNDYIFIQVETDTATFYKTQKQLRNQKIQSNAFIIPSIDFVRYKDGLVKIDRYPEK